jgi:hypothetical protein
MFAHVAAQRRDDAARVGADEIAVVILDALAPCPIASRTAKSFSAGSITNVGSPAATPS